MINPNKITNYNQTQEQLEENILWWVCAAGKSGIRAARSLDNLLNGFSYFKFSPFKLILKFEELKYNLPEILKKYGIGCYNHKARTFLELAHSNLDLKTCTVENLESIYGVGCKTSHCFLLHSRPNVRHAGLDTHILQYLSDIGFKVPKSTPVGKKYKELEQDFFNVARILGYDNLAELDLKIWNAYSGMNEEKRLKLIEDYKLNCY